MDYLCKILLDMGCKVVNNLNRWFKENKLFFRNHIYKRTLFRYKTSPGDYCKGVTPDPIPNSAVKPFSANGTLS